MQRTIEAWLRKRMRSKGLIASNHMEKEQSLIGKDGKTKRDLAPGLPIPVQ
jgi:hypothetical protein